MTTNNIPNNKIYKLQNHSIPVKTNTINNNKITLSICMMVKNEQSNLRRCLDSLLPLLLQDWCELVIVDTGSTDNTVDIAKKYTNKIYFKQWNNNFSEIRNYSMLLTAGQKIMFIDADEQLTNKSVYYLEKVIQNPEFLDKIIFVNVKNFYTADLVMFTEVMQCRIFYNDGSLHYEGKIHNKPKVPKTSESVFVEAITFNHYGYQFEGNPELKEQKKDRNLLILLQELEERPNDIHLLVHIVKIYTAIQDYKNTIIYGERWLKEFKKEHHSKEWIAFFEGFIGLVGAYLELNDIKNAERVRVEAERFSTNIITIYLLLGWYYSRYNFTKAVHNLEKAVKIFELPRKQHEKLLMSCEVLIPKAYNFLANYYYRAGNLEKSGELTNKGIFYNNNRIPLRWDFWNEPTSKELYKYIGNKKDLMVPKIISKRKSVWDLPTDELIKKTTPKYTNI